MIDEWAHRWGLPRAAVLELRELLRTETPETESGGSEAGVQSKVRLEASRKGIILWRNNCGAYKAENGSLVRYGLANDNKEMNSRVKSSDLIGIRPVIITPAMVGSTLGQFVAIECKRPGWKFHGSERETAQQRFHDIVVAAGGWARFVNGEGQI